LLTGISAFTEDYSQRPEFTQLLSSTSKHHFPYVITKYVTVVFLLYKLSFFSYPTFTCN